MKTRIRVLLGATAAKAAGSIGVAAWLFIGGALPFAASAQTRTWIGGGANALASTTANWAAGIAPSAGESVLFDNAHYGNAQTNVTWDLNVALASWAQTANYGGVVTLQTKYPGQGAFTVLTVTGDVLLSGGKWTHLDNSTAEINRLSVSVGGNLTVASGAVITADAIGYDGTKGPGVGSDSRAGAGHGGTGGDANTFGNGTGGPCYGSVYAPTNCGSGGSLALHSGGGAIIIQAGGAFTVNGLISANGRPADSTGNNYSAGAGGSVFITAGSFGGSGALSANGGSRTTKYGGGGGGGRIAVVATNTPGFGTVSMQAFGGTPAASAYSGGAGTIYTKQPGQASGTLSINNKGLASCGVAKIPAGQSWQFDVINVISQGMLFVQSGTMLGIPSNDVLANGFGRASGFIVNRGIINTPVDFVVTNCTLVADQMGTFPALQNLTIGGNAVLTHSDNSVAESYRIDLSIPGAFTVHSGGAVNVDFLGYDGGQGLGVGLGADGRSAGGYGGRGGDANVLGNGTGGSTYGSVYAPTNCGSGGRYAFSGGGVVIIRAGGVMTVNGLVSANGQFGGTVSGNYGCGSGGSIMITATAFEGIGTLRADGGSRPGIYYGAGGGGGRIALLATTTPGIGNLLISAYGGNSAQGGFPGGSGTFYYQAPDEGPGMGTVKVKNVWTAAGSSPCTLPAMLNPVENLKGSLWVLEDKGYLKMAANAQIRKMDIAATTAKLDLAGWTLTTTDLVIANQVIRSGTYTAANIGSALVSDSVGTGQIIVVGMPRTLIMIR